MDLRPYAVLAAHLLGFSAAAAASDKGIYGTDDRLDIYAAAPYYRQVARSVAAVMDIDLTPDAQGLVDLRLQPFKTAFSLCSEERFSDQPVGGYCTAALVGKDLVLTAGHCLPAGAESCRTKKFVFGYQMGRGGEWPARLPAADIYSCSELLGYANGETRDFAVIKLDRPVPDRSPLAINRAEAPQKGEQIFVIGTPLGLPLKVAGGASVRSTGADYFMTDLDTYGGNSGSPVFNAKTGLMEGILTGGGQDLELREDICVISYQQPQNEGTGEMVSVSAQYSELIPEYP